jgi:hypothetical protein
MSAREGMDERRMGWKRGVRRRPAFVLKSGSVAWAEREKWGRRGCIRVEAGEGGGGGPGAAVGSAGQPAMALDCRVWPVPLLREQRRAAGVGDTATWAKVGDKRDWDEVGPGGSSQGAREKERESDGAAVGCQHVGPGGRVPGGAVQPRFETKSEFNCFKQISNCYNLWSIRKVLS